MKKAMVAIIVGLWIGSATTQVLAADMCSSLKDTTWIGTSEQAGSFTLTINDEQYSSPDYSLKATASGKDTKGNDVRVQLSGGCDPLSLSINFASTDGFYIFGGDLVSGVSGLQIDVVFGYWGNKNNKVTGAIKQT